MGERERRSVVCRRRLVAYLLTSTDTKHHHKHQQLDGVLDFVSGIDKLTASLNGGTSSSSSQQQVRLCVDLCVNGVRHHHSSATASSSQQQQQREEMRRGIEAGKRGIRVALDFLANAVGSNGVGIPGEFTPSPEETWRLVEEAYPVSRNLVRICACSCVD